jgi:iron-sulfur cluster assembly accessory protein
MELTDAAISKAIERTAGSQPSYIRLGVTAGGCVGFEYIIEYANKINNDDIVTDYGKFKIVIDKLSESYLKNATLDWMKEGLNESFRIINPNETASCGCGVSIGF